MLAQNSLASLTKAALTSTTIGLLVATAPNSGSAQSRDEIFAMQSKLQQEGFYKAEIDGLSGPSMRNAIKTYATFHSIEDSFKAVKSHMIQDTVRRRRTPTDIEVQSSRELMNETLRDGPSAIYRDEFALETKKGVLVCGRVNGKNAYGAYVGFKSYSITFSKLTLTETTLFPLGDPEFELAELFCLLGTSFGMAVIEKSAA